jgi:hypothetical protein
MFKQFDGGFGDWFGGIISVASGLSGRIGGCRRGCAADPQPDGRGGAHPTDGLH